jgi:putative SOS response-associated peptidase YedK
MCGRYSQRHSGEAIAAAFELETAPAIAPRYNIAPTQPVSVILATPEQPQPHHQLLRWGLIPSWAKTADIGSRLINARAETAAEKPSFRAALRRRRCLVLADGFYEWQVQPEAKTKQPYFFQLKDHSVFAFAGLWEHWSDPQSGGELSTCTLLTTAANDVLAPIHHRMPVILPAAAYAAWLDPTQQQPQALQPWLAPYPAEQMERYPVDRTVNSPRHDTPDCLAPLPA